MTKIREKREVEFLNSDQPPIFVIAKMFNEKGSLSYRLKNKLELRGLPDILELLRPDGMQVILLSGREVYAEYTPYTDIEDLREFINLVGNTGLIIDK